jgi:hypothetical protein
MEKSGGEIKGSLFMENPDATVKSAIRIEAKSITGYRA